MSPGATPKRWLPDPCGKRDRPLCRSRSTTAGGPREGTVCRGREQRREPRASCTSTDRRNAEHLRLLCRYARSRATEGLAVAKRGPTKGLLEILAAASAARCSWGYLGRKHYEVQTLTDKFRISSWALSSSIWGGSQGTCIQVLLPGGQRRAAQHAARGAGCHYAMH